MSHGRHDYPKAIHLLRVQGRAGDSIFFPAEILREYPGDPREHAPDLQFWENLLARVCDRHDASVHGYTWLPNEAVLLLQRFAVPLRIILPTLLGRYSRYLHDSARVPRGQSPFLGRCASIEVTPELLPYALRHLYARAARTGLSTSPLTYPLCSVRLHLARSVPSWFETREFIVQARKRGHIGRANLDRFFAKPESQHHARLFERLSSRASRIAGERSDIEESEWLAGHPAPVLGVEQIAKGVEVLLRKNAKPLGKVLAVALTTWYATRAGAATLAQMGRRFDRQPTTLRADIESHRKTSAALFELSLEELQALIPTNSPTTVALRATSRPDVAAVSAMRLSASSATGWEPSRMRVAPNTPAYGAARITSAMMRRRGGTSRPRASSDLASACMISKEDTRCLGAESDRELTVVVPRRTRKESDANEG